jgi:formate dehydrogenase major subunit
MARLRLDMSLCVTTSCVCGPFRARIGGGATIARLPHRPRTSPQAAWSSDSEGLRRRPDAGEEPELIHSRVVGRRTGEVESPARACNHSPMGSADAFHRLRGMRGIGRALDWGLGPAAASKATREAGARTAGLKATASVCPYCAVGCGQVVYTRGGELVGIEGNPRSPINQGTLCPKGSASRQLVQQPGRITKVLYRRPHGTQWEELELERAMEMIAERLIAAREAGWQDRDDAGRRVDRTLGFAHLGGATLDNEENYLIKKAFCALGAVQIENQARI